jgi:hypothetical protein
VSRDASSATSIGARIKLTGDNATSSHESIGGARRYSLRWATTNDASVAAQTVMTIAKDRKPGHESFC